MTALRIQSTDDSVHVDKDGVLGFFIQIPELAGTAIDLAVIQTATGKFKEELALLLGRNQPFKRGP